MKLKCPKKALMGVLKAIALYKIEQLDNLYEADRLCWPVHPDNSVPIQYLAAFRIEFLISWLHRGNPRLYLFPATFYIVFPITTNKLDSIYRKAWLSILQKELDKKSKEHAC